MCVAVSAGDLFLKEHASSSASTDYSQKIRMLPVLATILHTSQTINSPLFELFECDIGRWRREVEIQPVLVLDILVCGRRELFLPVIQLLPLTRINSREVLSDHR